MRDILRIALGVVFTFFFLVFLLLSAIRFEFLRTKYWTRAVEKSGFYQQIEKQIEDWQVQLNKQAKGGQKLALAGVVTEERARDLVETNVERLVEYLNGGTKKLLVYLPVNEWKIPKDVTVGLPWKISQWSKETEVGVLAASLGFKAEGIDQLESGLLEIQKWSTRLGGIWFVLLIICLILLAIHYSLGRGRGKIKGSLWLLAVSGLTAGLIGLGGGNIFRLIFQGQTNMPVWLQGLVAELLSGFFRLGGSIGGVILVGAVIGLVVLMKMGMGKEEKEKESLIRKLLKLGVGVTLGAIILGLLLVLIVLVFGGQVNLRVEKNP